MRTALFQQEIGRLFILILNGVPTYVRTCSRFKAGFLMICYAVFWRPIFFCTWCWDPGFGWRWIFWAKQKTAIFFWQWSFLPLTLPLGLCYDVILRSLNLLPSAGFWERGHSCHVNTWKLQYSRLGRFPDDPEGVLALEELVFAHEFRLTYRYIFSVWKLRSTKYLTLTERLVFSTCPLCFLPSVPFSPFKA